jgi:hypothetical protein
VIDAPDGHDERPLAVPAERPGQLVAAQVLLEEMIGQEAGGADL